MLERERQSSRACSAALLARCIASTLQKFAYMFKISDHFAPEWALIGVVFCRRKEDDVNEAPTSLEKRRVLPTTINLNHIMIAALITLKVIEWMSQTEGGSGVFTPVAHVPPPPKSVSNPSDCIQVSSIEHSKCPLCREKQTNPCTSNGGYVFCESCITDALRISPKCPVTGFPCSPDNLIRLYQTEVTD